MYNQNESIQYLSFLKGNSSQFPQVKLGISAVWHVCFQLYPKIATYRNPAFPSISCLWISETKERLLECQHFFFYYSPDRLLIGKITFQEMCEIKLQVKWQGSGPLDLTSYSWHWGVIVADTFPSWLSFSAYYVLQFHAKEKFPSSFLF